MRIISGTAKGHPLKAPQRKGTRPTSDLIRGAIFNMIETLGPDWARVLDLYAGSGGLGIEALSRGAEQADFVEINTSACATIRENLARTGLADQAGVYCMTVHKALSILGANQYDIILLDPPYDDPKIGQTIADLARSGLVRPEGFVVVEHARRVALADAYDGLSLVKSRRHGDTVITIFRQEALP